VTELVLIIALEGLALALVLLLVRVHAVRADAVGTVRVISALERASAAFLARERLRLAPIAGALAFVLFGLEVASGRPGAGMARGAGVVLGVTLGALVAAGGARIGGLAGGATVDAARSRFDAALSAGLRLAGGAGLGAQALGTLGVVVLLLAEQVLISGAPTGLSGVASLGRSALPAYAVGAALAAFSVERAASAYGAAATAARHRGAIHTPPLAGTDAQHPALVAGLVGAELRVAAQATHTFALAAIVGVLALMLPSRLGLIQAEASRLSALGLVLPTFGLIACTAGVLVARTEEASHPAAGLLRGLASAIAVTALGLAAGSYWLFPECWALLTAAGAVGLLLAVFSGLSLYPAVATTSRAVRDAQAALRAGAGMSSASALASGIRHAALAVVLVVGGALGSRALGAMTGLPSGERIGLFVALTAVLSLVPFALATAALGGIADSALGILSMASADAEVARRVKRLEESARATGASAESYLGGAAALVAASIGLTVPVQSDALGGVPLVLAAAGVAGAALALAHGSLALGTAVRGSRDASLEVDRQLGGPSPRPEGRGAPPSYRACEEQCARSGLEGVPLGGVLAILPLVLLGIALDLVYRGQSPRLAPEVFAVLTAGAAVTALWVALTANGARAVLLVVRRASRPDGDPAVFAASVGGSSLIDILGGAVGPAACSLSLMASSIGLLAPFLR
jgi:Na+/H+-translocating membrane pyrophosphatase